MSEDKAKELAKKYPVRAAILELTEACNEGKSVTPMQVAQTVSPKQWRKLLSEVKAEAVRLAKGGTVTILRKGKPVDPDNFKGVYRIGRTPEA